MYPQIIAATIRILKDDGEFKKGENKYYACIHKILTEGIIGSGLEDMDEPGFIKYMKDHMGITINSRQAINKYALCKKFGSWEFMHFPNKTNEKIMLESVNTYARKFIETYRELLKAKASTNN